MKGMILVNGDRGCFAFRFNNTKRFNTDNLTHDSWQYAIYLCGAPINFFEIRGVFEF